MAKKVAIDLNIQADGSYNCSSTKTYTDQFVVDQEVTYGAASGDGFQTLSSFSKDLGALTTHNAKALVIKNTGNICAELILSMQSYKNSSSVDVVNNDNVGLTEARNKRKISTLLPAGDFIYLPNSRYVAYDNDAAATVESASSAAVGSIGIEPKDINSGNEYRKAAAISGTTYGAGSDVLIDGTVSDTSATAFVVDDGSWFKTGDLLILGNTPDEVVEVVSVSGTTVNIKRGLLGTDAGAITNNEEINYFYGNEYLPYDQGKCQTDASGKFKQRGAFFGYGRTADSLVDGLVPGSVVIGPFYSEGGYLDFGLSGIKPSDKTGLSASTTYTFHIVVDEFNNGGIDSTSTETAIAFTTDSSDTTFAGSSNAVIPKIQAVFDEEYYGSGGLANKKVTINLHRGDIRIQSHSNHSETRVGIANVSGTTPFDVGRFPSLASGVPKLQGSNHGGGTTDTICYGPASSLAPETMEDKTTNKEVTNINAFLLDDGNGNLLHNGTKVGWVDYEKGHCEFTHLPNSEFKIYGQSHSAHSGGVSYLVNGINTIESIIAKSVNKKENAKLQLILLG